MWACCWCCRIRSRSGSKSELRHNNSNRLTRRSVCPALCCLPITSSVINETDPGEALEGIFLPLLLRDHWTTSPAGRHSHGFCKLIVWEASHHFILPPPAKLLQQAEPSTSQLHSPKAEFTARPLLRQQIPARCRSLRLLSWLFFFFFWP